MKNGVIVATMLPVSKGHAALVRFALNFLQSASGGTLTLIMYSRSFEPVSGSVRFNALCKHFEKDIVAGKLKIAHCDIDDIPQNPSEDPVDFWGNWRDRIREYSDNKPGDYLFSSEEYGLKLAEALESYCVPYDRAREIIDISGTRIRQDPIRYFDQLIPELQAHFRQTVTLFGQESCGKTTMSKLLAKNLKGHLVPEWARGYLETVGAEVTPEKMNTIVDGQFASQMVAQGLQDKPFIFQDTDLLSTIGYYKFWSGKVPEKALDLFYRTRSNLYFVMNDAIPFEQDILRYGVDKRETDRQFWIDLLQEFGCKYRVVQNTDLQKQLDEIMQICTSQFNAHANMSSFIRT